MIFQLLRDLQAAFEIVFEDTVFSDPAGDADAFISPRIYTGALPPKRKHGQENHDFPYIVIRATDGTDGESESSVDVEIHCGIYTAGDEAAGANDLQTVIDRVRAYLLVNQLIGKKFRVKLPINWTAGSDDNRHQPHPLYLGQVRAQFDFVRQEMLHPIDEELDIYGSGLE